MCLFSQDCKAIQDLRNALNKFKMLSLLRTEAGVLVMGIQANGAEVLGTKNRSFNHSCFVVVCLLSETFNCSENKYFFCSLT